MGCWDPARSSTGPESTDNILQSAANDQVGSRCDEDKKVQVQVEAVAQVRLLRPDIVLMDLVMPEMDGVEATRQVLAVNPGTKVIVLSSFAEDDLVFPAIEAGAAGYLLKDIDPSDLHRAIRAVHQGEILLSPDITKKVIRRVAASSGESASVSAALTPRELEVLTLIAQGQSNREIARHLAISEKTVKTHVGHILEKLQLSDRTQAAIYAHKHGLAPNA